ncbi:MAG: choice-of-anchor A family protein [Eubacterium sp.]|nr:choice-of-anchor A family protein [Eubacterium sp.]
MYKGHWRRWTAILVILLLIAAGGLRTVSSVTVYAGETGTPGEESISAWNVPPDEQAGVTPAENSRGGQPYARAIRQIGADRTLAIESETSTESVLASGLGTGTERNLAAEPDTESELEITAESEIWQTPEPGSDPSGDQEEYEASEGTGQAEYAAGTGAETEYEDSAENRQAPDLYGSELDRSLEDPAEVEPEADLSSEEARQQSSDASDAYEQSAENPESQPYDTAGAEPIDAADGQSPEATESVEGEEVTEQEDPLPAVGILAANSRMLLAPAAAASTVTLEDENYNIRYFIQSGYQAVCFGNADIELHTMGSLLVQGDLIEGPGSNGIADSAFSVKPSYIAGYVYGRQGFNNRQKQNPVQVLYVGSSNTITENGKKVNGVGSDEGYNHGGTVVYNDDYIDWEKLKSFMTSLSTTMLGGSTQTLTNFNDWQELTVSAGSNVTFSGIGSAKVKIKVSGANNNFTVINIPDSGTVYVPQVLTYNGQSLSTNEDNEDMPIIFNFPNATSVIVPSDMTPSFGHILAPNADVTIKSGNFNGMVVCNNFATYGEGHLRNYHGDLPEISTFHVYINKVDENGCGIAGARLTLRDSKGDIVKDTSGNQIGSFISTGSPVSFVLPEGVYTLSEEAAPDGYELAAPVTFTVDSKGNVIIDNEQQPSASVTMTDKSKPKEYSVKIRKVDEDGAAVVGADLTVTTADGTAGSFTTDGNDWILRVEPNIIYTVKELNVPAGYEQAEDILFEVSEDGTMTVHRAGEETGTVVTDGELVISMVDRKKPLEVTVGLGAEKLLKNGTLTGGEFTFVLEGVPNEKTDISQTWVDGYYEQVLEREGYWESVTYPGFWWNFWYPGYTQWIWHPPVYKKVWHPGQYEQSYETVTINPPMPEGSDEESHRKTAVNAGNGSVSFGSITFTEEGTWKYRITETAGLYRGEEDKSGLITYDTAVYYAVVTVTQNGNVLSASVTYQDESGNPLDPSQQNATEDGKPVFINEEQICPNLKLHKVNGQDCNLTPELYRQVAFSVTYTPKGAAESAPYPGEGENGYWIPGDDGYIDFGNLMPGTYVIEEKQAPADYMKLPEPVTVTVSREGIITLVGEPTNYVHMDENINSTEEVVYTTLDQVLVVRNYPYIEMPEAGRNSQLLCYILGPVISLAGLYILLRGRRQKTARAVRVAKPAGGRMGGGTPR